MIGPTMMTAKADRAEAARQLEALAVFEATIDPRNVRSVASWVCQNAPEIELTPAEEVRNELILRRLKGITGLAGADYDAAITGILRRMWKVHRDELCIILEAWEDTNNGSEVTTRY
jgi:hypothetical protein